MSRYRIKIEERNNGEKLYTPQVCDIKITGRWIKKQQLIWYNILGSNIKGLWLSETSCEKHSTEEGALRIIDIHKNIDAEEENKKIKSTKYKMIGDESKTN